MTGAAAADVTTPAIDWEVRPVSDATPPDWFAPVGDDPPVFDRLVDTTAPTVVVRDEHLQSRETQARGYLRSVPLFAAAGFETVLHTDAWADPFCFVESDYRATETVDPSAVSFPAVHLVTQAGISEFGEERLVRRLVERSLDERERYVLVTDTAAPRTPTVTKKPGKSIVDEFGELAVRDYDRLAREFVATRLDSRIPVVDTRNVFVHAASTVHAREDAPAASIADLFDYTAAPSNSPVWAPVRALLERDGAFASSAASAFASESGSTSAHADGDGDADDDAAIRLRTAVERRLERGDARRIAEHVLAVLDTCACAPEQFAQYRSRPPSHR